MDFRTVSILVWQKKAYIPETAFYGSGIIALVEPVHIVELSLEPLVAAVREARDAVHERLPTPTAEEARKRKDPVLKYTGAKSLKELAKTGAGYSIDWTPTEIRIDMSRLDKKGRFETDSEKTRIFPPDTPLETLVTVVLDDVRSRSLS